MLIIYACFGVNNKFYLILIYIFGIFQYKAPPHIWHQRHQFNCNSICISSLSDRLTEPQWPSLIQTTSYPHPSAVTCPKDTLRINAVVALRKAQRKSNSVGVGVSIHAVDEKVRLKTQPPTHSTPIGHSTIAPQLVLSPSGILPSPSSRCGFNSTRKNSASASKLVYNCVTLNFVSRTVSAHVS